MRLTIWGLAGKFRVVAARPGGMSSLSKTANSFLMMVWTCLVFFSSPETLGHVVEQSC